MVMEDREKKPGRLEGTSYGSVPDQAYGIDLDRQEDYPFSSLTTAIPSSW